MSDNVQPLEVEVGNVDEASTKRAPVHPGDGESEPMRLAWHDIRFVVPDKASKSPGTMKTILDGVSGIVEPGEVLFAMGPSGSGKTSLLDSLADRVAGDVGGYVWVNRAERDPKSFKHVQGYVQQEDALPGVFTVTESLHHAAAFYIDESYEVRAQRVEEMIKFLGLSSAKDTRVGNVFFRGLSGGQRRRLSVGVEMIARPAILFLDEPTSGLDSASTYYLMEHVRDLARTFHLTVVATIHQPSARVLAMSDKLLLLSKGQVMYFGPTTELVPYLESTGNPCPVHENPADFVLDLINSDFDKDGAKHEALGEAWLNSENRQRLDADLRDIKVQVEGGPGAEPLSPRSAKAASALTNETFKVSWGRQFAVLFWRTLLTYARDPATLWLRVALYGMMALLVGIVWIGANIEDQTQDIINSLFFVQAFLVFMSISVLPAFITERAIFIRERSNGAYTPSAWMVANTLAGLLPMFGMALISSALCYWLVGYRSGFEYFAQFVWILFLSLLAAEALMVLVAIVVPIFIVALALGACWYGFSMCVQGFFRNLGDITPALKWARWISAHSYSFDLFMENEFRDREGVYLRGIPMTGNQLLKVYDLEDDDYWTNCIALIGMAVFFRAVAWYILHRFYQGKK